MFHDFFYLMRQHGLDISLTEWLTVQEALSKGLHGSSLTGFFYLCRSILCKSEAEYDKFGEAFQDYFYDVLYHPDGSVRADPSELTLEHINTAISSEMAKNWSLQKSGQTRPEQLALREQTQIREGSVFTGFHGIDPTLIRPNVIQVSGKTRKKASLRLANWDFKDFREDNVLSIRQFQMAFRKLCIYSDHFGREEELDINRTIHDTCQKGGVLQIRRKKPRRNTIKVLLLIDSGGTMTPYHELCSRLFQAASRSNRFKDLKIYYFHNCIDEYLYTNPTLRLKYEVSTKKVFRKCDRDYRVIMVGDGTMEVSELLYPPAETTSNNMGYTGQDWLKYLLSRYRHTVWMAPILRKKGSVMGTWGQAYDIITDLFDMYPLTVAGLEQAMKKLMVRD